MAVTATVTPGKVFGDSDVITKETLNQLGQPTVSVDGSVGSLALSDGSVTNAKVAGDAAINLTKLEGISRGSVIIGNSSGKGAVVDANDNGKILVGDGTDLNSVAVSGDISLASTGAVTITSGAVEAGMLNTNAAATSGGLEVSSGMKIKDDGIDPLTKLAGHADRKGQLITYDSSGDPVYVNKGTTGQVLKGNGDNPPSFGSIFSYNSTASDTLAVSSGTKVQFAHSLSVVPSLVRAVLVCQSGGDHDFAENDELNVHSIADETSGTDEGLHSVVADANHVTVTIHGSNVLNVMNKNSTSAVHLTRNKWKIKVYATP
tara:strand:+ start:1167 stop:2120 length:954 start_codon:yes stop_codon:yes gene_type:complete